VEKTQTELTEVATQHGAQIQGSTTDITDVKQLEEWVQGIGAVDILVSNVSSLSMGNDAASWTTAFNADMLGVVNLVNICLPYLTKTKGSIVTISSVSGREIDFTATVSCSLLSLLLPHITLLRSALYFVLLYLRR
jgi:3-oxoacyl-[acyl-carrier protein] reductase